MSNLSEDLRVLKETREYFSDPNHWTDKYYGKLSNGKGIDVSLVIDFANELGLKEYEFNEVEMELDLVRDRAVCRCLIGELAVTSCRTFISAEQHFSSLFSGIGIHRLSPIQNFFGLAFFNDIEGYEAVLILLDEAIARIEKLVTDAS